VSSLPSSFVTTNPATYEGRSRIYRLQEMLKWPPPEWLVEGLVPKGAMSGLYGAPGTGKSMLALDWALCVASGTPWLGHEVQQGYVLYIAAEGHSGLAKRAQAWLQYHDYSAASIEHFGLVKERIAITDGSVDYETVFARLEEEVERVPHFVVIDTLARAIEGDENDSTAMAMFLNGAERWIEDYGATVLVIHHGNAAGTRERGHTSFKGALGALLRLSPVAKHKELLCLHTDKQRDAAEAEDIGLTHEVVPGTDSVVLVKIDLPAAKGAPGENLPAPMRKADMLLLLAASELGYTWQEWRLASGIPKHTFNNRLRKLLRNGEIFKENGRYFVFPALKDLAEDEDEPE
jgi:KaiC/GvpD/RAD55 family RecA-like ATPase